MESYDENDIEDFEDYLEYYGIDAKIDDDDDNNLEVEDIEIDSDIRELFF